MTDESTNVGLELGKAVLAVVLLVGGSWVLLVLLGMGPPGWLVLVLVLAVGYTLLSLYREDGETDRADRINCPNCGARLEADSERCDYCEEPLSAAE